ncbi:hypothetical protein Emtol_1745 [Emticicia oligotrophica DSM 17448]|jgi:gas vesicle protein|uniref:YtxH domain-containing protein n=1 Tax=Emticicia oligotrophica (strain DSM 17448 / CIP 109782 / MTCC 6937 / GPTSA100-15) TaxID=929562 RepID=A0ABM5N0I2_EMTOG|nr:YtxH domain-containing protein [Emticicia oligotrophica]AFK02887.1 hypothetical protein Emtol_1745 [Emticicia oligotrophica DSM 17448]
MVNAKHLATFVLGAAAGVALHKYLQTEEGEKALEDLKSKAGQFKDEAEQAIDKAPEYFEKLKTEAATALKDNFPEAEAFLQDLFNKAKAATNPPSTEETKA